MPIPTLTTLSVFADWLLERRCLENLKMVLLKVGSRGSAVEAVQAAQRPSLLPPPQITRTAIQGQAGAWVLQTQEK